jgi:glycosyltransferase involved in cell wall biosynthesis
MPARVLYLSYDGMCDPLGGSQVLPYLFGLARRGHNISLISFEKPERTAEQRAAVAKACTDAGIAWHPVPYRKRPPVLSTMADVTKMWRQAAQLNRHQPFDLVHCRGYLSAIVGLRMKRRFGTRFLFDMRGFWADERMEGGSWKRSNPVLRLVYDYFKRQERTFWREADAMVSLTQAGETAINSAEGAAAPITIIPCCVDFGLFKPATKAKRARARTLLGIDADEPVLGYIGSLGGNYMLDQMLDFFRAYRERFGKAKFLFVTQVPESEIRAASDRKNIDPASILLRPATRLEVPDVMAAVDHGIAFKQPSFSAKACSPTKLGEMLALEIPVVTNAGVGDVAQVIADTGAGVIVRSFEDAAYSKALSELQALTPDMKRWRQSTRRWFDLNAGIDRYDALYRDLAAAAHA